MHRQEVLRAVLTGSSITKAGDKQVEWATIHSPLQCPAIFTPTGRRINKFCIGSDPEFSFARSASSRVEAAGLGLTVGLAAGMDQNERLVELRPFPSPSVVKHVAGILTDLRWLYRTYLLASGFWWRAGAFFVSDGMGGHVHFGRKRPTRKAEVDALDGLARAFQICGMFPLEEWRTRNRPDRFGQVYGSFGDFRLQAHGYEYRTLPSWLQTPAVAFVALCASKLAVIDPDITTTWRRKKLAVVPSENDVDRARNLLRGLAKYYKGRDDDAYVMYHLLTKPLMNSPFVVDHTGDFRHAWGIPRDPPSGEQTQIILPSSIEPDPKEETQILDHLLQDTQLTFETIPPKFKTYVPEGYRWLPWDYRGDRRSGFGDFLHNLVVHPDAHLEFGYGPHDEFRIIGPLSTKWRTHEKQFLRDYYPTVDIQSASESRRTTIIVPKKLCQGPVLPGLKAILLNSGMFPIWTVNTVEKDSQYKWEAAHPYLKKATWRNV